MIEVKHSLSIRAKCPKNGDDDLYDATITLHNLVSVEDILETIASLVETPIFQEDLTRYLAESFSAEVVTAGDHGKVTTTCRCDCR